MFGVGLKHLWKAINVIQFIVFFLVWQVNITFYGVIFLEYLKNLAFFEFLKELISEQLNTFECPEDRA